MLTRQGRVVVTGSVASFVAGRLLGIFELHLLAAGGAVVLLLSATLVGVARLRLDVDRRVHPRRVHVGGESQIELVVRNVGRRRTPLAELRDPVGGDRTARVLLAPLRRGEVARASYRLPTDRRGVLPIGPLEVRVGDPFGLAAITAVVADVIDLTVFPAVDDVVPPPLTRGDDTHGGASHADALAPGGEEFYALRPYEVGDDLRRVHWPASARHDELMVRQEQVPWQGRATIVLDVRRHSHTGETLERAVSAAASLVVACRRGHHLLRLLGSDGYDSGWGAGEAHVEAILERLATATASDAAGFRRLLAHVRDGGGSVVALLGGRRGDEPDPLAPLRGRSIAATTVRFDPGRHPAAGRLLPSGMVIVDEATSFPAVWNALSGTRRGARRPVTRAAAPGGPDGDGRRGTSTGGGADGRRADGHEPAGATS